jgi:hypothetical protein
MPYTYKAELRRKYKKCRSYYGILQLKLYWVIEHVIFNAFHKGFVLILIGY